MHEAGRRIVAQILDLVDDDDFEGLEAWGPTIMHEKDMPPTAEVFEKWLVLLVAGRAAEELVFGQVSVLGTGSEQSDLGRATQLAKAMELRIGFGETGLLYAETLFEFGQSPISLLHSVRRRLEDAMAKASARLIDNREALDTMAAKLFRSEQGENLKGSEVRLLN